MPENASLYRMSEYLIFMDILEIKRIGIKNRFDCTIIDISSLYEMKQNLAKY